MLIIFILGFLNHIYAQDITGEESLNKLKELSGFENWPGKIGSIRGGINLSNYSIPGLPKDMEIKNKIPFSIWETDDGEMYIKYRSYWQSTVDNFIEVTFSFFETCKDAHEYLIKKFFNSQLPFQARIKRKDQSTIAGDISFSNGSKFI